MNIKLPKKEKNPNFRYKSTFNIIEQDIFEINNAFDVYNLLNDKNIKYKNKKRKSYLNLILKKKISKKYYH